MTHIAESGNGLQGNSAPMEFLYNSNNKKVRTLLIENQPWFVAKDVCEALTIKDHTTATRDLDDDEKGTQSLRTLGGFQSMLVINESGLYNLIFRSTKPEAKVFRKWVTAEVLPQIRKTGKFQPATLQRNNIFTDARDVVYDTVLVAGKPVRHIILEDTDWYSLNDLHQAIGVKTDSTQAARKLNARKELARKVWVFGNTHPAWFCRSSGMALILSGSRYLKGQTVQISVPLTEKGGHHA